MTQARIRALFAFLLLAPVAAVVALLARPFAAGGLSWAELGLLALYGILLAWIGAGFWFCVFGLFVRRGAGAGAGRRGRDDLGPSLTAIVVPVYHEDAEAVFARIRVMYASLQRAGHLNSFEFFVLSDSRDSACWEEETRCWFAACRELQAFHRLFYRRRADNHARKSGNIEEFCRNWGRRYDYMIVLDADSLMAGGTMVEMVRRMEADPGLALLQTAPVSARGVSLFARVQQFAGALYGDLLTLGLSRFLGVDGTYWGHNAIIRMRAFARCCALPALPGREPLGGLIMSHDFVEAALLVAAGWRVRLDADLKGSFEEGPPSLIDHAARDRRWCQGNLQHFYLLFVQRLHGMSRLNFLAGIMSYASGPLWLLFMILAFWTAMQADAPNGVAEPWVMAGPALWTALGVTAAFLFGPKLISLVTTLLDPARRRLFGGGARLALSVLLESLLSILIAPVMMALHTRFVLSVLAGRHSGWGAQRRDAGSIRWGEAARAHGLETLLGVGLGVLLALQLPTLAWWLSPVIGGLVLAIPISVLTSRAGIGRAAQRIGLALAPCETAPAWELTALDRLQSSAILAARAAPEKLPSPADAGTTPPAAADPRPARLAIPAWLARQRNAG